MHTLWLYRCYSTGSELMLRECRFFKRTLSSLRWIEFSANSLGILLLDVATVVAIAGATLGASTVVKTTPAIVVTTAFAGVLEGGADLLPRVVAIGPCVAHGLALSTTSTLHRAMLLRAASVATAVVVALEDAFISFAVLAQLIFLDVAIDARSRITGGDGAVAALALSRSTGVVQLAFAIFGIAGIILELEPAAGTVVIGICAGAVTKDLAV